MPTFQKKPVEIEAFQLTKKTRWDNIDWPEWLNAAWQKEPEDEGAFFCRPPPDNTQTFIHTLEGDHEVSFGDWIIKGLEGDLYPCKDSVFRAKYEPVARRNMLNRFGRLIDSARTAIPCGAKLIPYDYKPEGNPRRPENDRCADGYLCRFCERIQFACDDLEKVAKSPSYKGAPLDELARIAEA